MIMLQMAIHLSIEQKQQEKQKKARNDGNNKRPPRDPV